MRRFFSAKRSRHDPDFRFQRDAELLQHSLPRTFYKFERGTRAAIPFIYQKIGMHGRKSHPAKPPAAKAGPIQKDAGWFVRGRIFEYAARTPRCHRLFRLFLANIAMHEFRNAIPVSLGQVNVASSTRKPFFAVHQQVL